MPVKSKNIQEIDSAHKAGQVVRKVLDVLGRMVAPGVTTRQLDMEAARICVACGAECLFNGVPGSGETIPFPGNICASIDEEIVHGIPGDRMLREGEIISVDFGARLNGWCGDAARTFLVGNVDEEKARLVKVTRQSLDMAIALIQPGIGWSRIAGTMSEYIRGEGFSVVEEFVGHGIGEKMHESPKLPNFISPALKSRDIELYPGMILAIEPMVNMGGKEVRIQDDGWTAVTIDGKPSAHWEHTVAVTEDGAKVLTA